MTIDIQALIVSLLIGAVAGWLAGQVKEVQVSGSS